MNTYGLHGIHGRAPAIASGVKMANKDLDVWIITGDGDGLSIGGNHFIHLLRRNFNVNVLLFNNEIYGLTKGQYSPTSPLGKRNKTALEGVVDLPLNPVSIALGASSTFIARVMDMDGRSFQEILKKAHQHKGTSFVEIYQNCNVFNDQAFDIFSNKKTKLDHTVYLQHGEPLIFGSDKNKGIRLDSLHPVVVDLEGGEFSTSDLWIHDEFDSTKAYILSQIFGTHNRDVPRPFGVIYQGSRPTYEQLLQQGEGNTFLDQDELQQFLNGSEYWVV